MTDELKEILESSVLNDDTKTQLSEAFDNKVNEAVKNREVELAEQYEEKKSELAESVVGMIEEAVSDVFSEIQEEIKEARNLDVRYAVKLEEFKEQFAKQKSEEIQEVLQDVLKEELSELSESIEEARQNLVGQKMFETFKQEYGNLVEDASDNRENVKEQLEETQKELKQYRHEAKVNELLEGITGRKRNIMKTLMEDVETDRLEERFNDIHESVMEGSENPDDSGKQQLSEGSKEQNPKGTVVLEEGSSNTEDDKNRERRMHNIRRMAGIV